LTVLIVQPGETSAAGAAAPVVAGRPAGEPVAGPVETPLLRGVLAVTTAGALLPGFFPDALIRLAQAASLLLRL